MYSRVFQASPNSLCNCKWPWISDPPVSMFLVSGIISMCHLGRFIQCQGSNLKLSASWMLGKHPTCWSIHPYSFQLICQRVQWIRTMLRWLGEKKNSEYSDYKVVVIARREYIFKSGPRLVTNLYYKLRTNC